MALRTAIRDILAAFAAELADGDDEEPVPAVVTQAFRDYVVQPGDCYGCHGHTGHDGAFHAAVTA